MAPIEELAQAYMAVRSDPGFRAELEAGASAADMADSWRADERAFKELRAEYLLY